MIPLLLLFSAPCLVKCYVVKDYSVDPVTRMCFERDDIEYALRFARALHPNDGVVCVRDKELTRFDKERY